MVHFAHDAGRGVPGRGPEATRPVEADVSWQLLRELVFQKEELVRFGTRSSSAARRTLWASCAIASRSAGSTPRC